MAKEKERAAPYVSAATLWAFLGQMRKLSPPKGVDRALLLSYGLPKGNVGALLSTLKFLGLVSEDGTPTPAFRALQTSGEEFRRKLKAIVERAYEPLFSQPEVLRSREETCNYFARTYSPAISGKATSLFIELCGEAGIPLEGLKRKKKEKLTFAPEGERPSSLKERYLEKLIDSLSNITIGPGMEAEAIKEAREALRERHDLIKEMLAEIG